MLTIEILSVGRLKQNAEEKLQHRYLERIQKTGPTQGIKSLNLTELNESKLPTPKARKNEEAEKLLAKSSTNAYLIALDEHGKTYSSIEFANLLKTQKENAATPLCFLLGGPDGHGETVQNQAHLTLSLSTMTLPHGLARIVLLEQIYRTLTIWTGHPYHRT